MRVHHVRRGAGEPLLLVHGIGDSHRMWTRVLGRLARGHECFAVDVPGFGRTPPLESEPTIAAQAAALREFMAEQGHDSFHVAGDSMGGAIALELATTGAARSATALSPAGFTEGWEHLYCRASLRLTRASAELLAPYAPTLTRSPLARMVLAGQMVARGDRYSAEELAGTLTDLAAAPSFHTALGPVSGHQVPAGTSFPCPVTIAWGSRDYLLLYGRQAARAHGRLPSARHVTLHGCGHIPTWDDPEQVEKAILETTASAATPRSPRRRARAAEPASPR